MKEYRISCGKYTLELGRKTVVMGILNVTPDSFSDGGKFIKPDDAVFHAEKMIEDGAGIIDIGGESTRPGSDSVPTQEELDRVVPVVEYLAERISVPISVDTMKAEVARQSILAGASIINDVSSMKFDSEMADVVAEYQVPVMLMHMKGEPKTMQKEPHYDDLISEVIGFLKDAVDSAVEKGIKKENIIIDPGIGFGKTFDHNLMILRRLHEFNVLDAPILIGSSRKAFIRNLLKEKIKEDFRSKDDLQVVEIGSLATVSAAVLNGAHIVRVHDVAKTSATVKVIDAIKNIYG